MLDSFRGKGAMVTGAASGIGFAVSEEMLKMGGSVFLADRDEKALAEAVEKLREHAGRVYPMVVDVTQQIQVQKAVRNTAEVHGSLDFLFNNAGIGGTMQIETATLETWRRIIDINLWGVIYGVDAALPIMRKQGHGHIVNTSSIAGIIPPPYQALYCASKYAVTGMTECLRYELANEGVRFSLICPGNVATNIFCGLTPPDDAISPESAAKIILTGVANNENLIIFPEKYKKMYEDFRYHPVEAEKALLALADERREAYRKGGKYY